MVIGERGFTALVEIEVLLCGVPFTTLGLPCTMVVLVGTLDIVAVLDCKEVGVLKVARRTPPVFACVSGDTIGKVFKALGFVYIGELIVECPMD